ncbi:hypothetical protein TNCV_5073681 [Trichonephila clavipes]|nr:hypothetical protein TNCV_5073681 [Trichonephila clavipes]
MKEHRLFEMENTLPEIYMIPDLNAKKAQTCAGPEAVGVFAGLSPDATEYPLFRGAKMHVKSVLAENSDVGMVWKLEE